MPSSRRTSAGRGDLVGPLIFDIRPLSRRPGSMRAERRTAPAPEGLRTDMSQIRPGAPIDLDVQLESVTEGVLVTATATMEAQGECARCLEPVTTRLEVHCQELFSYEQADGADEDGYPLTGDRLDFEPALRDAVVLALPLAPLCRDDCPGLCPDCGVPLAQAGPDHRHERVDPRWAGLRAATSAEAPTREETGRDLP